MNIIITRPERKDRDELEQLFDLTISGAFANDGMADSTESIKSEVAKQMKYIESDLASNGKDTFYLIAKADNRIAGTIAIGAPNKDITNNMHIDFTNVPEIKSVYIHPQFQRKGIGSMLFTAIVKYLKEHNIKEYVLDAGYKYSQPFWIKKLGPATVVVKDFYGVDFDYLIWRVKVKGAVG